MFLQACLYIALCFVFSSIFALIAFIFVLPILARLNKRIGAWCCREIMWHRIDKNTSGRIYPMKITCMYCGNPLMMDSQGNLFT